jgi:arsenate reductase
MGNATENMVLFVCVENTFRSIMSEAIFNAHAPKGWRAESAGVQPADRINPLAIELLQEIGIQVDVKRPKLISPDQVALAWRVVTFGCVDRCPIGAREKSEDWPIPGSTGKTMEELRELRTELQSRILNLIEHLPEQAAP